VSNAKLKRARSTGTKNKATLLLYNKLTELIGCIADLVDIQELTDTLVLQLSTLSVSPFFVENISELQLSSLKLVTNVSVFAVSHTAHIVSCICEL
jgi:cohesin loading factor subunit SCC2